MDISYERWKTNIILPSFDYVSFVAKVQRAKTRKGKDYFVLRATVPKEAAEKMNVKPGDYLFFKARKAEWYHMLDWRQMETTWRMLPSEIRNQAILEGLPFPGLPDQAPRLEYLLERCIRALLESGETGSTSPTTNQIPSIISSPAEGQVATPYLEGLDNRNRNMSKE